MKKQIPEELIAWVDTVLSGRPTREQAAAKSDLASWINMNIRVQDRRTYQTFCMDYLVDKLDEKEKADVRPE